jgi:uncharacterized delta-60 repeat protein
MGPCHQRSRFALSTIALLAASCGSSGYRSGSADDAPVAPITCANYGLSSQERADGSLLVNGWRSSNEIQKSYTGNLGLMGFPAVTAVTTNGSVNGDFGRSGTAQLNDGNWRSTDFRGHPLWQMPDGGFLLQNRNDISRFKSSGVSDTAFGDNGTVSLDPMLTRELGSSAAVVAADRRGIVVLEASGQTKEENGLSLFRLHLDGTADPTFGTSGRMRIGGGYSNAGGIDGHPQVFVDAKYITVMEEPAYPTHVGTQITRYTADGILDSSFATDGTWKPSHEKVPQTEDAVMRPVPDGLLVNLLVDDADDLIRLDSAGAIDRTFGDRGSLTIPPDRNMIAVGPQGQILLSQVVPLNPRASEEGKRTFFAYTSDGKADASFGTGGQLTIALPQLADDLESVTVLRDGSFIATGTTNRWVDDSKLDTIALVDALLIRFDRNGVVSGLDGDGIVAIDTGATCQPVTRLPDEPDPVSS